MSSRKATAKARRPALPGGGAGRSAPVSHNRKVAANGGQPITRALDQGWQSTVDAPDHERKRSALVGVSLAREGARVAELRFNNERRRLRAAVTAARDEGATVAEIAAQMGISRNGVYKLMDRIKAAR
jgi:DNA-directed RNA polymerase specialized sigma24 family protein